MESGCGLHTRRAATDSSRSYAVPLLPTRSNAWFLPKLEEQARQRLAGVHAGVVHPLLPCSMGHVATTKQLEQRGVSRRVIARSVEEQLTVRLRKGVYGCTHLDESVTEGGRLRGALTCVSTLRPADVWVGHDERLHVIVPPSSSPPTRSGAVTMHCGRARHGLESLVTATAAGSLWQAIHCLPEEDAIAALESAIHEGFVPVGEVLELARNAPQRLNDGFRRLVTNSGSGNETIVRLRLQRAGFRVESQPFVPGMGHEDLLVHDCVGLDVDGRRWHGEDRFTIDQDRDLHVERLGPAHYGFERHTSMSPGRTLSR